MAPPSLPWILVCPASRGIGRAVTRRLLATTGLPVVATTRAGDTAAVRAALGDGLDAEQRRRLTVVRCDVGDEASVREAAAAAAELFPPATHHLHLGCALPGVLHAEKSPAGVDAALALDSFRVNAVEPLLLAKHFFPLLPRRATVFADDADEDAPAASTSTSTSSPWGALCPRRATWLTVAARVGSTADNRAGGWFSYRASKAAVISLARSLDLFLGARSGHRAVAVAYHPGTVRTDFSRDFWAGVPADKLFSPEYAAERLVDVGRLRVDQRGRCCDWKGDEVPP